jgi:uncharacterized protein with FMN-binding domain
MLQLTKVKKFLLSALVLIVFTVYAVHTNLSAEENSIVSVKTPEIIIPTATTPTATIGPTPVPTAVPTKAPTPVPTVARTGKYKDGTYTGSVADAFYGNIQVKVVISGGQITDVIFLQYPNDRNTSIEINSQAMPILKQEAISAQSAQVSGVSGATATSQAFIESLGSALSQAS